MNPEELKKQLPHPHRVPWLTLAFIALAVVTFVMSSKRQEIMPYGVSQSVPSSIAIPPSVTMEGSGSSGQAMPMPSAQQAQNSAMRDSAYYPAPQPYYGGQANITDTREFLKTNYNATMRTRDVQGLSRRVETTVRGYNGRIDQITSSPENGYVSFVVPADKFDTFRDELEGLVNSRFLSVRISAENLLPQKQNIEGQQKQVETSLADLQTARKKLVSDHTSTVKSLQSQIDANAAEHSTLESEVTNDPVRQAQITARIKVLSDAQIEVVARLANENASYKQQLAYADQNIKYTQDNLANVKTQDQNLLDNVATVNGSVSLRWISLEDIAQLYLPGYWIPGIFAVLAILAHFWHRRRTMAML